MDIHISLNFLPINLAVLAIMQVINSLLRAAVISSAFNCELKERFTFFQVS